MAQIELVSVEDAGRDVLLVTAIVDGETVYAYGHVSATSNHYDPDAYGADGHLLEGAKARQMTAVEVGDYARSLIADQLPPDHSPLEFA